MAGLIVLLLLAGAFAVARAIARRLRSRQPGSSRPAAMADQNPDMAARFLRSVITLLPSERADWGQAMLGELQQVGSRRERWVFASGCAIATLLVPARAGGSARPFVSVVLGAIVACAALTGVAFVRYPGLITGAGTWLAVVAFGLLLAGYAVVALVLAQRTALPGVLFRRAVAGAVLVCTTCILVSVTVQAPKMIPTALLLGPLLSSIAIGAAGGRPSRRQAGRAVTGFQVAMLSGVVAGLSLFILWTGITVLGAGAPYDAGQLRDFAGSGAPDLATYAVSDNLGSAMVLLILVPLMTTTLGAAGAAAASGLQRRRSA